MRPVRIIFIFLLYTGSAFSQPELVTVSGQARVEYPDFKSRQQVEKEALDLAQINALETAFGRAVIQGNSTYIKNLNNGQKTQTSTVFNMIANTFVKGEVVEILDQEFREIKGAAEIDGRKKEIRELDCKVKIRAKEISESAPEFQAVTLACPNQQCSRTDFKNNESIYLHFRSPDEGFLSVFLDDGKITQRLLPFSRMQGSFANGVPIRGNTDYILFSKDPDHNYYGDLSLIDEYQLTAESQHDQNRIFILFSPTSIETPVLKEGMNQQILTDFEKDQGYRVPSATESEDFQEWLIKSRIRKTDLKVQTIDITITR